MSYIYIQSEPQLWTVGTYANGSWTPESDHSSPDDAGARVHYLNGGSDAGLRAELAEADRAFEELASAARRLLRDLAHADPGGYLPQMAEELAGLVLPAIDTPETAHAAGEED